MGKNDDKKIGFYFFTYECCRRRLSLIMMINEVEVVLILLSTTFDYECLFWKCRRTRLNREVIYSGKGFDSVQREKEGRQTKNISSLRKKLKTILWTHRVENTLKLFDTYLFFILFRRFLLQLAHLLLDALQHRVCTYRSLDYAFRRLSDAFLNFWFLHFGFLGSHIFLVL